MRAKGPIGVLVALLVVSLLLVEAVRASHSPTTADVVAVATASPWFMDCSTADATQRVCETALRLAWW